MFLKMVITFLTGSELTETSQVSNEIKAITQRLSEPNSQKMTQIEQQLNSKFEEILKEISTNRGSNLANGEEDAENNRHTTSNSKKNKSLRRKHASNNEIDKDTNHDNRFQSSEIYELRQPSTPFGVVNETIDDTIKMNENRQETDYHMGASESAFLTVIGFINDMSAVGVLLKSVFVLPSLRKMFFDSISQKVGHIANIIRSE